MTDTLAEALNRPLRVGAKTVANRLVLAPMAQITHAAFRELLAGFGGYGLLFSEMCAAKSVPHGDGRNPLGFMWRQEELPTLVCQIFGNEPAIMAAAAERIEREGFFGVDINFGCCVSAVCRQTCGAALLKYPRLAAGIVAAVRRAVGFPLWVKFRTGWRDDPQAAVDMARRFEDAGADALTFHPRVAPDVRSRRPKWAYIKRVKASVAIPVFGNGDVFDARDCERMLRTTGCDGVALGRLAIARPWVFAAWTRGLLPGPHIYRDTALTLAGLLPTYFDAVTAHRRFNRFVSYFAANFHFGHTLRRNLRQTRDMGEVEALLGRFFDTSPAVFTRPNLGLLR